MSKLKVIDLFSGAGGLSLGFVQTGRFKIVAAVEKNNYAVETYKKNFGNIDVYDDIKLVDFNLLKEKYGHIDVVIGGPPCQGFSNANRQHNQAINQNNKLVKQYIRAILELRPDAFVMENVSMLKSDVHRFYKEKGDNKLIKKYGISYENCDIFLLDKEYKFPGICKLLVSKRRICKNQWDPELYEIINIFCKNIRNRKKLIKAVNKYYKRVAKLVKDVSSQRNSYIKKADANLFSLFSDADGSLDVELLCSTIEKPISIQKMLITAKEIYDNSIVINYNDDEDVIGKTQSCAVYSYLTNILQYKENGYVIDNGILSAADFGVPQKRRRFIVVGVKNSFTQNITLPEPTDDIKQTTVKEAIEDLEIHAVSTSVSDDEQNGGIKAKMASKNSTTLQKYLRDSSVIFNHVVPETREIALSRFRSLKEGQNFHSLSKKMKENTYSNADKTQNTVYLRLTYDEPSSTVTNVRKSMWIHPILNRAVSIREAARLQAFPDSFVFCGPKDSQYQQVGNAVPPILSNAIAEHLLQYIDNK